MKPLRIALTKGRLEKTTIELLEKIGYNCDEVKNKGRRLILPIGNNDFEVVLAKAADVITYVEHGVCDLGVVGKDTILENGSSFYELLVLLLLQKRTPIFTAVTKQRQLRQSIPM